MFGDKMKQQEEVAMALQCGHPHVAFGTYCNLCKKYLCAICGSDKTELDSTGVARCGDHNVRA
jgi:hypothetical protein